MSSRASRLRLRPDARPVRRAPDQVQFGLWPDPGLVVAGLTDPEARLLLQLGSPVSLHRLQESAARTGIAGGRVEELLGLLREHGLMEAATDRFTGRLQDSRVCVLGHGLVPDLVRDQLSRCGIGRVSAEWLEDPAEPPDLLVLVSAQVVPPQESSVWHTRGMTHLPVVARHRRVLIGPLVNPPSGPCLRCLELHRRDRDTAWPRLLAQLAAPAPDLAGPVEADPALTGSAAGVCAMVARSHLTGLPAPPGTVWELSLPWPEVTVRTWSVHPACSCGGEEAGSGPLVS